MPGAPWDNIISPIEMAEGLPVNVSLPTTASEAPGGTTCTICPPTVIGGDGAGAFGDTGTMVWPSCTTGAVAGEMVANVKPPTTKGVDGFGRAGAGFGRPGMIG